MNNKKITNRKKSQEKLNIKTQLIKSEKNKTKNSKNLNYDKIDPSSILRKINLSKVKTDNKINDKYKRIKRTEIENLTQTKSFINISNKDDINNKKLYEKNKSALNSIKHKKEKSKMIIIENERNKNKNSNINLKLIKDNNHKKFNTMYIATNFKDKNSVYVQSDVCFLNKRNKEKKTKFERFIKIDQ